MQFIAISLSIIFTIINISPAIAKDKHNHHYNNYHSQRSYNNDSHYSDYNSHSSYRHNNYQNHYDNYQHRHKKHYNNRHHNGDNAALLIGGLIVGGIIGALITQPETNKYSTRRQNNHSYYNPYQ